MPRIAHRKKLFIQRTRHPSRNLHHKLHFQFVRRLLNQQIFPMTDLTVQRKASSTLLVIWGWKLLNLLGKISQNLNGFLLCLEVAYLCHHRHFCPTSFHLRKFLRKSTVMDLTPSTKWCRRQLIIYWKGFLIFLQTLSKICSNPHFHSN